ncbi:MAG: DUF6446 family protein [Paracoccaceae bacterium]|nr:DUF6446 family protein [Paracoccaceae bacterium]
MTGKILIVALLVSALLAGAVLYYLQIYGYYRTLAADAPEARLSLTTVAGAVEPLAVRDLQAIDADTSPIRFRACFRLMDAVPTPQTYRVYPKAEPLVAPGWFGCFDAAEIGAALQDGTATAYLGVENYHYGIDRIVAVLSDGRAFAWHQINRCGREVFEGNPAPEGCPAPVGN